MQTASEYREHAQECIDLSKGKSISERVSLLTIAAEWLRLADLADLHESFADTQGKFISPSTDTAH